MTVLNSLCKSRFHCDFED